MRARLACQCLAAAVAVLAGALPAKATRFAPPLVIQCPGSDELRQVPRLGSGNGLHARRWSDGYVDAPMDPDIPAITRCARKGPIFWVSSAHALGEVPHGADERVPAAWRRAPEIQPLAGDEYLEAIERGLADTADRLFELRRRAWWAANQAALAPPRAAGPRQSGPAARANLEALLPLFDESDATHLLMKAEALRELGRFDEAAKVLDSERLASRRSWAWFKAIREGVELQDVRVVELKPAP